MLYKLLFYSIPSRLLLMSVTSVETTQVYGLHKFVMCTVICIHPNPEAQFCFATWMDFLSEACSLCDRTKSCISESHEEGK